MFSSTDTFLPQAETWVNEKTGEKITGEKNIRRIERKNFEILYAQALYDLFDEFGSKKLKVLRVILENKDFNNVVIMTQDKIAELANVSRRTVIDTMKILEERGVIKKAHGAILVSPKLMNRGSHSKEKWLITKFEEFEENKNSIVRTKQNNTTLSDFTKNKRKERKKNKEKIQQNLLEAV